MNWIWKPGSAAEHRAVRAQKDPFGVLLRQPKRLGEILGVSIASF